MVKPVKFYSFWDELPEEIHEKQGEINSGENLIEPGDSRPIKQIIQEMRFQGLLNQAFRFGYEFDVNTEVPDDYMGDPTLMPGFDMIDASNLQKGLVSKLLFDKDKKEKAKQHDTRERRSDHKEATDGTTENPEPPTDSK